MYTFTQFNLRIVSPPKKGNGVLEMKYADFNVKTFFSEVMR